MIVVHTHLIIYLLINGENTSSTNRLFQKDSDWIAPNLWKDEFLNLLSYYEKMKKLSIKDCIDLINEAELIIKENSYLVDPNKILMVAKKTGCTSYDSQFIALAEELDLMLYTFDKQILKACPNITKKP